MKRNTLTILLLLLITALTLPLWAEEAVIEEGFGLQAAIFSMARKNVPNLDINLTLQADYPMTPGDIYNLIINEGLDLNGKMRPNMEYPVQLGPDYFLDLPLIGRYNCRDKNIPQIQREISSMIRERMPIQYSHFTLKVPAQFHIFVHGGVNIPGEISANAMFRVIDAIALSGGFKPGASYRLIELHRDDEILTLDLSKFYSNADYSANPYLQPGDRIYIPRAEVIAVASGQIMYPGAYEMLPDESAAHLIAYAGGLKPDGDSRRIEIARINTRGETESIILSGDDLTSNLSNGDQVRIPSAMENSPRITVEGALYGKPVSGDQASVPPTTPISIDLPYSQGSTLLSILDAVGGPTPFAEETGSFLIRENGDSQSLDIHQLWKTRNQELNVKLQPGDSIFVPIKRMKVFVAGEVKNPGMFDYFTGLTAMDYILMAGGPTEEASTSSIAVVTSNGSKDKISLDEIPEPGDILTINRNFIAASDEVFKDIVIYTTFVTTLITAGYSIAGLIVNMIYQFDNNEDTNPVWPFLKS